MKGAAVAVGLWLSLLAACGIVVARTSFTTDLSAFLPRSPTPTQQVLVDQLREGVASRWILIGISGDTPEKLAAVSRQLARDLRRQHTFTSVDNGDDPQAGADRDFVWKNRYLMSPNIAAEIFLPDALHERLRENLRVLASPAGIMLRRVLPHDPTGEILRLAERLAGGAQPDLRHGVWFAKNGTRAVLVARTRAPVNDLDAQERAIDQIKTAFTRAAGDTRAQLTLTGPGVFTVSSRATIKREVMRFALIAAGLIAAMLLVLFRSPRVLALSLVPVASGALAGVAAVSVAFGEVHGVTLGFGVTLLGEGVDYAIYLFSRTTPGASPARVLDRIWPTLRLGVLTSICGFSAMLFSGFTGLAQLGLFSITGLITAAAVTRGVLPVMLPQGFFASVVSRIVPLVTGIFDNAHRLRYAALGAIVLAAGMLAVIPGPLWSNDLASLSPVSRSDQQRDQALRRDLGAPDVRYLIVVQANSREAALEGSESVAFNLRNAMRKGLITGYDAPSVYLPSQRVQRERQDALPGPSQLRANVQQALTGLPFRSDAFEPFIDDVTVARKSPLITRQSLDGTRLAVRVDALLVGRPGGWTAMLPLTGVLDAAAIRQSIRAVAGAEVVLLDIKSESDRLYASYRDGILRHSLLGAGAIVLLLFVILRSPRRVLRVLMPLFASVIIVTCALALIHGPLSIFHLVGLLLVVAVGSNYSLFFDRDSPAGSDRERTRASLLFACASTLVGFGVLSFSSLPVLNAIGSTVGMGAFLSLVFAAILSQRDPGHTREANATA